MSSECESDFCFVIELVYTDLGSIITFGSVDVSSAFLHCDGSEPCVVCVYSAATGITRTGAVSCMFYKLAAVRVCACVHA
jgi:hypothetical protein